MQKFFLQLLALLGIWMRYGKQSNTVFEANRSWRTGPSTRQWERLHLTTTSDSLLLCPDHCSAPYVALRWAVVSPLWLPARRHPKSKSLGVELLGHKRSRPCKAGEAPRCLCPGQREGGVTEE